LLLRKIAASISLCHQAQDTSHSLTSAASQPVIARFLPFVLKAHSQFFSDEIAFESFEGSILCTSACVSNAAVSQSIFLSRALAKDSACEPVSCF